MRAALLERGNPAVKALTVLVCGLLLFTTSSWQLNLAVMAVCLALLVFASRCRWTALVGVMGPALLLAAALFTSGYFFGTSGAEGGRMYGAASLESATLLGSRILACVGLGLLFGLTTDSKRFVASLMHQFHLKPKFAYGVLAAFHLLPTLAREWEEVRLAYRVRGKASGALAMGPLFNTLVNSVRWSENVAMAMESKGFDGDAGRTHQVVTRVKAGDVVFFVLSVAAMGAAAWLVH